MTIYPGFVLGQSSMVSGEDVVKALNALPTDKKLSNSAIKDAVMSVNGQKGTVQITAQGINAQASNPTLSAIASTTWGNDVLMATDDTGHMVAVNYTNYSKQLLGMTSKQQLIDSLGLQPGQYPVSSVNGMTGAVELSANDIGAASQDQIDAINQELSNKISKGESIPYSSLTGAPSIPQSQVNSDWNSTSGPSQILNKPVIFDGNYNSLSNRPILFSGDYGDLSNRPILFSGKYSDLTGKPVLSTVSTTGSYNDLTDKPTIPQAQVNSDWNAISGPSQILNKPILFSGNYADLSGKPVLFNGDYNSLTNKPTIPVVNYPVSSVNTKTGAVVLDNTDVGAAALQHTHALVDVAGLTDALASKLSKTDNIPYSSITGVPVIPTNTNQLTNGSGFVTSTQAAAAAPVQSVNGKTGTVVLTASDVGAASASSIPTNNSFTLKGLSDTDDLAVANGFLRWNSTGTSVSYTSTIPYSALSGAPTLATVATSGSYADLTNKPTLFDGTWASLTGKPTFSTVATSGSYADLTGKPTIPAAQVNSDWSATSGLSQILNKPTTLSGYGITDAISATALTTTLADYATTASLSTGLAGKFNNPTGTTSQYLRGDGTLATFPTIPVTSVNSRTGAVVLSASDVGAAPSAQGTKYYRAAGTQATGVKVKYYSVTSDSNGAWTLSLGSDFTELLDVQATAVSTSGITGVRQASLNAFTSTSTTLTGNTWGNTVLVTILISGTNSLSLTPNTVVRVRVEGIGT